MSTSWKVGDKVSVRYMGRTYKGTVYKVAKVNIHVEFATRTGTTFKQRAFAFDDPRIAPVTKR